MAQRYDIRKIGEETYAVVHIESGKPVEVNGVPQVGLDIQDADDLAEALDIIADQKDRQGPSAVN